MYKLFCGNNVQILKDHIKDESVDFACCSPPYDLLDKNLKTILAQQRDYKGYTWNFVEVATELCRTLKQGGMLAWIVGDVTRNHAESCTPERQKLYFYDELGMTIETMIYHRDSAFPPMYPQTGEYYRYANDFEYIYIISKGKWKTFNPILDRVGKYAGQKVTGRDRNKDGTMRTNPRQDKRYKQFSIRSNIWYYSVGSGKSGDPLCHEHPASFPEQLVGDLIRSFSNEGETIVDPFVGSGTTIKMAELLNRNSIGIDCSEEYIELTERRLKATLSMPLLDSIEEENKLEQVSLL